MSNNHLVFFKEQEFQLLSDIGNPNGPSADNIFLYGQRSCGKSYLLNKFTESIKNYENVQVFDIDGYEFNSIEKDGRAIFDVIFWKILGVNYVNNLDITDDSLNLVYETIKKRNWKTLYFIFENAEKFVDVSCHISAFLKSLIDYTISHNIDIDIVNIFCSSISKEKLFSDGSFLELFPIYVRNFTELEVVEIILSRGCSSPFESYYRHFVEQTVKVTFSKCTDITELSHIVETNWALLTANLDQSVTYGEFKIMSLSKELLQKSSGQLFLRGTLTKSPSVVISGLQLPYFGRFLLIAAYIASHNSPQTDRGFFVKVTGKISKRAKTINKKPEKTLNSLIGPRSFTLDRLFAIFSCILESPLDDGLWSVARLVNNLVSTKLLVCSKHGNDALKISKYKCVASFEVVDAVASSVFFDLKKHLTEFADH